jgi:hypothetical protein
MEPIDLEFEISCSPEHAFATWTEKASLWWPRSHTMSRDDGLVVTFEPRVGGRIYETGPDGVDHEWGEVTLWDPPHHVGYLWHLFFDRSEATEITVSFTPTERGTSVRLLQTGFDRLPTDVGLTRRHRTEGAWGEVTGYFREAVEADR